MKIGDLVELLEEPEHGYGLIIAYDKETKVFEIEFPDEYCASYFCTKDDECISMVSRAENKT